VKRLTQWWSSFVIWFMWRFFDRRWIQCKATRRVTGGKYPHFLYCLRTEDHWGKHRDCEEVRW
jgi:hypothetical protein